MFRYIPLFALIAAPAAAHQTALPHVHGSEAGLWLGLALIGTAAGVLLRRSRARSRAARRDRT